MIRLEPAGLDAAERLLPLLDTEGLKQTGTLPLSPTIDNLNAWLDENNRRECSWLIIDDALGKDVGMVGAWGKYLLPSLGYQIGLEFAGRGYATAATRLLLQEVLQRPHLIKVQACVFQTNPASRRVLEKAGFQFVKDFVDHVPARGGDRDAWLFEYRPE